MHVQIWVGKRRRTAEIKVVKTEWYKYVKANS
jgi:hypothetical protein